MIRTRLSILLLLVSALATESSADPVALRDDITIRPVMQISGADIRIVHSPQDSSLYLITQDGTISRVDVEAGTRQIVHTASDHGINSSSGIGFAIDRQGTFFVLGTTRSGTTAIARVASGRLNTAGDRDWTTLMQTEPYPLNGAANDDHAFNTLAISPDDRFLFVANGSRTDHGEVQTNKGKYQGLREAPLSNTIFRLPSDGQDILLPNDADAVAASGYVFCKGLRNNFDMAFAANGDFCGVDNGPDREMAEELNWLRQGHNFGFPWRLGTEDNPQRNPNYDPDTDLHLPPGFVVDRGFYRNDPDFPPPPGPLTDPVPNIGPHADRFRDEQTGEIRDASDEGITLGTFTPHRSPLGLVFDVEGALAAEFRGDGFTLNIGDAIVRDFGIPFQDPDEDLLHLDLEKVGTEYQVRVTRLVGGFNAPIDGEIVGNHLYVIEFQPPWLRDRPRFLWEVTLPAAAETAVSEFDTDVTPESFSLEANYPNPFNPSTTIRYHLPVAGEVDLTLYNVMGQAVRTLVQQWMPAGNYAVTWNGTDDNDRHLGSGTYAYRLRANGQQLTRHLTLLK